MEKQENIPDVKVFKVKKKKKFGLKLKLKKPPKLKK